MNKIVPWVERLTDGGGSSKGGDWGGARGRGGARTDEGRDGRLGGGGGGGWGGIEEGFGVGVVELEVAVGIRGGVRVEVGVGAWGRI